MKLGRHPATLAEDAGVVTAAAWREWPENSPLARTRITEYCGATAVRDLDGAICSSMAIHFPARSLRVFTALVIGGAVQGCVFLPHVTTSYDAECQVVAKHVELKPVQIAVLAECRNEDCGALLVLAGVTAAGSAVLSGSVAIVGNAVYWLERQGNCAKRRADPGANDGTGWEPN